MHHVVHLHLHHPTASGTDIGDLLSNLLQQVQDAGANVLHYHHAAVDGPHVEHYHEVHRR